MTRSLINTINAMALQTFESEEKHTINATKNNCWEKEEESDNNLKNISNEVPKRTTRSKRLSKPKKEFDSLPFKKLSKEEKPLHHGIMDNLIKKRVLWGCMDKSLFFDALLEHGKDFDAIQNFMSQKQKKRGDMECNSKSKEQIRHFYYRTWHKICPFIHQSTSDEIKKQTIELQGVLCYGEIRKKVVTKFDEKLGHKLNELVHNGSAVLKLKGKKVILKAPSCKAKKLHQHNQASDPVQLVKNLLSKKISIELTPKNNKSWSFVQSLSQNPRILISMRTTHTVSDIINCLQQKWSQERSDNESKTKLKVHLPPNVKMCPVDFHNEPQTKSCKIKNDTLHMSEANLSENKLCKSSENLNSSTTIPLVETEKQKCIISFTDNNEGANGIRVEINDVDDNKKSSRVDKEKRDDDKESGKGCNADETSRRLTSEGLDDVTGGHMTIAKLYLILGCPEVIRLEYDWVEPANQTSSVEGRPIESVEELSEVSHRNNMPFLSSPYIGSRLKRLLEIACTEYSVAAEQKNKDSKSKEVKSSSTATGVDGFRVPDCVPPRSSQSLKNSEKRIMDQDLLQQMPIFQKKPDIILTRRSRKKPTSCKPIAPSNPRPIIPKMCPMFQQEILTRDASSSHGLTFSGIKDLMLLHVALPSVAVTSSSSSSSSSTCFTSSSSSSKPSLITMEPSELKPSVRRIIPIILNKSVNNVSDVNTSSTATTPSQSSTISKVITGDDVFLASKMFEDSNDNPTNHKIIISAMVSGSHTSDVTKSHGGPSSALQKQTSVDEHWIPNEELSLSGFLQDMHPAMPLSSSSNAFIQFFSSDSSRDFNHKFEDMQCFLNESSLDYASKWNDMAAVQSFPTSSSSQTINSVAPSTQTTCLTSSGLLT